MVCTAADGTKCPLAMVGKSKVPACFNQELSHGELPPMHYTNQKNAWFDKEVTYWWINNVFWPFHFKKHGDVICVLLIDNCSAQTKLDESKIPAKLIILYLPPNVTSCFQPADMGMIALSKVGYRVLLL